MKPWIVPPPSVLIVPPHGHAGSEAVAEAYANLKRIDCMDVVRMGGEREGVVREALRCLPEALVLYDTQYARSAKFRGWHTNPVASLQVRWVVGVKSMCCLPGCANDKYRSANLISALFCNQNFAHCLELARAEAKPYLPWGEMNQTRAKALGLDTWEHLSDLNRWFRSSL